MVPTKALVVTLDLGGYVYFFTYKSVRIDHFAKFKRKPGEETKLRSGCRIARSSPF